MSSKSDFLSWDDSDINLDLLLGEYTASDIDSDSENPPPKRAKKDITKYAYKCPECDSAYSSVSGFRGHLRKNHSLSNIKRIFFGVIAAVLLMALITVVILSWNINRKLRLKLQNNHDNLRPRGYPEQGNVDVQYNGIILHNTSDVSQYENAEANDTQRTLGLRTNYENQRTGGGHEYAYVNPANEQS